MSAKRGYNVNSEYAGFESGEVLQAKCFSLIDSKNVEALATATLGIAQLWSLYSGKRSDAIVETDSHRISRGSQEPMLSIMMDHWLRSHVDITQRHLKPIFQRRSVRTTNWNGSIDFAKNLVKNLGLIGPVESKKNYLDLDIPHIKVIRDAYLILSSLFVARRVSMIDQNINRSLHVLLGLYSSVPASADPKNNALKVRNFRRYKNDEISFIDLPPKISALSSVIDFCCDVVLSHEFAVSGSSAGVPGIKLNLNYLVQFALEEAMTLCGGTKPSDLFPKERINNIKYLNPTIDLEYKRWMSPDIYGFIQNGKQGLAYILDSKHKAFFSGAKQIPTVDRDDFYQLLSYSATHFKQFTVENVDWFYGLVGLAKETEICADPKNVLRYIDINSLGVFEIDYDSRGEPVQKKILAIPLRFSQLLYDCGRCKNQEGIRDVLKRLGDELLKCYEIHSKSISETL